LGTSDWVGAAVGVAETEMATDVLLEAGKLALGEIEAVVLYEVAEVVEFLGTKILVLEMSAELVVATEEEVEVELDVVDEEVVLVVEGSGAGATVCLTRPSLTP